MAISRAQLLKELLPGLNALFGLEYARYGEEHKEVYETETSERSFEEETKLSGFSAAPVKNEGSAIAYDNAQEAWTARYNHETIALGFSLTEEAIEDNLYDSLSARYTQGLTAEYPPSQPTLLPVVLLPSTFPIPDISPYRGGSGAGTPHGLSDFGPLHDGTGTHLSATPNPLAGSPMHGSVDSFVGFDDSVVGSPSFAGTLSFFLFYSVTPLFNRPPSLHYI